MKKPLLALAGWTLAILAGCASAPAKNVEIKGEAEQVLNRDAGGNSLSVAIRLYQLKAADEFSRLTFDMLANGKPDAELIGPELLEKSEIVLVPGGRYSSSANIRDDAKYVGVLAYFRQPDLHYWRFLIDADKVRREGLSFKAKDCYLILANPKPASIPGQPADAIPQCARTSSAMPIASTTPRRTPPSIKPAPATTAPKP